MILFHRASGAVFDLLVPKRFPVFAQKKRKPTTPPFANPSPSQWHKRVIRSGANTLAPFSDNPPERILSPGDILVVDLGPVFEAWEADFGRTYILPPRNSSDDAQDDDDDDDEAAAEYEEKVQLRDALEPMWHRIKTEYQKAPGMTGGELFAVSKKLAEEDGWVWGAHLAGHIVGDFPHERIPKDKVKNYVVEGNEQKMDEVDGKGHRRHWILEVHLRPQHQRWGGFFEQILTVD